MPELTTASLMQNHRAATTLVGMLEGNGRFVAGEPRYKRDIVAAREAAPDQKPSAAVFTCIDSRVTAESAFDCDFGQLLVVRTAGHVPDRAAVGSLEFAAAELGISLIVVLGHERCGAIGAALHAVESDSHDPRTDYLVEQLWQPASQALAEASAEPDTASHAMRLQVRRTVADLGRRSSLEGVLVVGAVYDLDTGVVSLIDEN
ncbi:carbonic anhydrase [Glycomyces buryatensis]|uniref:Carbonic anhydrase n=1 Tax=Glycomyces buryatensis TaxID=2570927 RepID=A0A4S8QFX3_9ACTN|nr:carbonic anhydrase [Glycomyces buryatensis]THV43543.1 carbonic anhydrase [Glycomyces buryatensis]